MFSKILGVHTLPWDESEKQRLLAKFNDMADLARDLARGDCYAEDNQEGASNIRKDMTRVLQFVPPIDVIEKVVTYLLTLAGHMTEEARAKLTGEEIVTGAQMFAFFHNVLARATFPFHLSICIKFPGEVTIEPAFTFSRVSAQVEIVMGLGELSHALLRRHIFMLISHCLKSRGFVGSCKQAA